MVFPGVAEPAAQPSSADWVIFCPPLTEAAVPLAVLPFPAAHRRRVPVRRVGAATGDPSCCHCSPCCGSPLLHRGGIRAAVFPKPPPLTEAFAALAVFWVPPLTEASVALRVFLEAASHRRHPPRSPCSGRRRSTAGIRAARRVLGAAAHRGIRAARRVQDLPPLTHGIRPVCDVLDASAHARPRTRSPRSGAAAHRCPGRSDCFLEAGDEPPKLLYLVLVPDDQAARFRPVMLACVRVVPDDEVSEPIRRSRPWSRCRSGC